MASSAMSEMNFWEAIEKSFTTIGSGSEMPFWKGDIHRVIDQYHGSCNLGNIIHGDSVGNRRLIVLKHPQKLRQRTSRKTMIALTEHHRVREFTHSYDQE